MCKMAVACGAECCKSAFSLPQIHQRLAVCSQQTYMHSSHVQVLIDLETAQSGSIEEDWSILKPRKIPVRFQSSACSKRVHDCTQVLTWSAGIQNVHTHAYLSSSCLSEFSAITTE